MQGLTIETPPLGEEVAKALCRLFPLLYLVLILDAFCLVSRATLPGYRPRLQLQNMIELTLPLVA